MQIRSSNAKLRRPPAKRGLKNEQVKSMLPKAKPIAKKPTPNGKGAPVGNKQTRDFGIYEHALIDEQEKDLFEALSLDSLDYEIKMLRLRLRRAYTADAIQQKLLSDPKTSENALMMNKHVRTLTPEGLVVSKEKVLKDYGKDIAILERNLAALIAQRNQVFVGQANENDELARIEARKKATFAMDRLFTMATEEEMNAAQREREEAQ
jgi:hypothetical protein